MNKTIKLLVSFACSLVLSACGGSTYYYSLSVTVTGLFAGPLVLANNNQDTLTLTGSTSSGTFPVHPADGSNYSVTVYAQPPGQTCTVFNGSGKIRSANVSNISVSCNSTLASATESVLYSFKFGAGQGGNYPEAALVQAGGGHFYGTTPYDGQFGSGTLFKLTPAGTYSVLHSFGDGDDGKYPTASLIQDAEGNFYGTTSAGGSISDCGVIFKLSSDGGNYSVIHVFSGGPGDGCQPLAALMQADDGKLYGTTSRGGPPRTDFANGVGLIFKINTDGSSFSILHEFDQNGDGEMPGATLIQASDGYLYGTTSMGGDQDHGTIFKIATNGSEFSTVYKFSGGVDGDQPQSALMQAADGSFYGTTMGGGSSGGGVVFKITTAGVESVLHSFAAGANPRAGLIQATDGNLYGATYHGGANGSGSLFSITTSGAYSLLHSFGGADGHEPQAGLIQAADGHLYGMTREGGDNWAGVVFRY